MALDQSYIQSPIDLSYHALMFWRKSRWSFGECAGRFEGEGGRWQGLHGRKSLWWSSREAPIGR